VTLGAHALQGAEEWLTGQAFLEALVLAILLGTAVRTAWKPGAVWKPGIDFSAKYLLEVAVMLLGASVNLQAVAAAGPSLLFGVAGIVASSLAAGYAICRALRLPHRIALLISCGNSICGNSAIAAVAPVIGADGDDVASSIAFTAILGVVAVLGLPALATALGLSHYQSGVLAGLTVYAVPQVLAATAPMGALSTQVGTLVKLVRVLMLGPVVLALSIGAARADKRGHTGKAQAPALRLGRLVPWFIIGFLALAVLRSVGLVPDAIRVPAASITTILTVVSMAALGLGVDVRAVWRVGPRVTAAVTASLLGLIALSLGLIHLLGIA
jgi:uncharacterized integral membrane protein (TIGR00698 family)